MSERPAAADIPTSTYYDAEFFDPGYLDEAYEENALTEGVAYQNAKYRGLPHCEAAAYQRLADCGDTVADGWQWHAQGGRRNKAY